MRLTFARLSEMKRAELGRRRNYYESKIKETTETPAFTTLPKSPEIPTNKRFSK